MFRDAAAFYTSLGFQVFPLKAGSKLPAIKGGHGFKDATDDPAVIDEWDRKFPKANIAIATGELSGIVVVDIDPRNGGTSSIAGLAGKGFLFPPCPEARTGNGGRHLIFAMEPGIRASKDKLGRGIDIKANGGYIVAAPSIIAPSDQGPGGQYRWVHKPVSAEFPRLPRWAIEKLCPKQKPVQQFEPRITTETAERSLEGMARKLATAPVGDRNNLLNWCAYSAAVMVKQGKIGGSLVEMRLTQAALAAGLPLPEIAATLKSGMEAAMKG